MSTWYPSGHPNSCLLPGSFLFLVHVIQLVSFTNDTSIFSLICVPLLFSSLNLNFVNHLFVTHLEFDHQFVMVLLLIKDLSLFICYHYLNWKIQWTVVSSLAYFVIQLVTLMITLSLAVCSWLLGLHHLDFLAFDGLFLVIFKALLNRAVLWILSSGGSLMILSGQC